MMPMLLSQPTDPPIQSGRLQGPWADSAFAFPGPTSAHSTPTFGGSPTELTEGAHLSLAAQPAAG